MKVVQSPSFRKKVRKFGKREKKILDNQIRKILDNPQIGQEKKSDLKGIFIYKFKIHSTQYLLSYRFDDGCIQLITIGPHENYYRDLSKHV